MAIDRNLVETLIRRAGDELDGDWLLVGGALALVWLDSPRTTEDIDLVSLRGADEDRLALMDLADSLGLPVEAVNSAADYFVRKLPGWRDRLEVLRRGARATVYRPDATLFLLLKVGRLSEADLDDCRRLLARCRAAGTPPDAAAVRDAIGALPDAADPALRARRAALLADLDAGG